MSVFGLGWDCSTSAGQQITCTTDQVAQPGEPLSPISARVQVSPTASDPLSNTATVSVTGDNNSSNDSDTDEVHVVNAGPDLTVDKSHTAADFITGRTETWRVSVSNQGSLAAGGPIVVTDNLPVGITYVGATGSGWTCGHSTGTVTCTRGVALSAGQTAPQIAIQVTADDDAVPGVTNSVNVSGPGDFDLANNDDADPTNVRRPAPDLSISNRTSATSRRRGAQLQPLGEERRDRPDGRHDHGHRHAAGGADLRQRRGHGLGLQLRQPDGHVHAARAIAVNQTAPSITLTVPPTAAPSRARQRRLGHGR